ncbi:MAG: DEAD/DEAH box helicase [Vicinamibacterales bacterium]
MTEPVRLLLGAELTAGNLPADIERRLVALNTFPNPDHRRKERLNLWTGGTDEYIRLARRSPAGLVVPVGNFPRVLELLYDEGIDYELIDDRVSPDLGILPTPTGELYDYQAEAVADLIRSPTGLLEAPTGSGKTNMLLSVPARLETPSLVLVHTRPLLEQTCERCRSWLGIEPGIIAGKASTIQPITVAMVQTLARRDLADIAPRIGAVLVDEVHHAPARTWASVVNRLPARYKYGFTATAWRKDGLDALMVRMFGGITARVDAAVVRLAGRTVPPTISPVRTSFSFALTSPTDWTALLRALVADEARNAVIVAEIRRRLESGARALVLSGRVEHVDALAGHLADLSPVVLTGGLSKADRARAMAQVRTGAALTLATTELMGEGVDVPGWDLLFLTTPISGGPRTLQAIGRVTRSAPGKRSATVVDFVDDRVPLLANAFRQRERVYRSVVEA